MTPEQIIADIKSDRVKKVIMDGDYSAEIDDQYTFMYAYGHEKLEVLGVNAVAHYAEPRFTKTSTILYTSVGNAAKVYWALGISPEELPLNIGPKKQITHNNNQPVDCESARFIIEMAHKYDEPIYIITTGPCSSAVNACLIDPSIMDKIVVVWLGGDCIEERTLKTNEWGGWHEWNMHADFAASQMLLNMDIPLIMLPCSPIGSANIVMTKDDLAKVKSKGSRPNDMTNDGYNTPGRFIKKELPRIDYPDYNFDDPKPWTKVMCDYMGVAAVTLPESMEYSIIPAPCLTDERIYALDSTRRKIIYCVNPNSDMIIEDATKALNNVVENFPYNF